MKMIELINYLENKYPKTSAHDMDLGKIGLQFGSINKEVKKVLIALDGSSEVVDEALSKGVDLLLLHHPFMFSPLLSVNYDSPFGKKLSKVISNQLNIYSMHTNFDVGVDGMNDILAKKLKLNNIRMVETEVGPKNLLRVGEIEPVFLKEFVKFVKNELNENTIRFVGDENKTIKKVGIVGGAGSSEIYKASIHNCDVLVTGEVHHHQAFDAKDLGISLVEVSHSVERHFAYEIKEMLSKEFPECLFIVSDYNCNPFKTIE